GPGRDVGEDRCFAGARRARELGSTSTGRGASSATSYAWSGNGGRAGGDPARAARMAGCAAIGREVDRGFARAVRAAAGRSASLVVPAAGSGRFSGAVAGTSRRVAAGVAGANGAVAPIRNDW